MLIELIPFTEEDIAPLTVLMKAAFDYDAQLHLGVKTGGPTGYDDGSFLREYGFRPDTDQFKILVDGELAGAVVLWIHADTGENFLGNLFLDVRQQNKGLGIAVWNKIEAMYPDTKVWRTDTPAFSRRNHNFYVNKCGFHIVRIERPMEPEHGSYLMEKRMKP